jgi:hypothetical protein
MTGHRAHEVNNRPKDAEQDSTTFTWISKEVSFLQFSAILTKPVEDMAEHHTRLSFSRPLQPLARLVRPTSVKQVLCIPSAPVVRLDRGGDINLAKRGIR